MMRLTMRPEKSQLSPNTPGNAVVLGWLNPGSHKFNKALYMQFGFTKFTALAIGAGGGRSGTVNVSGKANNGNNYHILIGASGGGGGGTQTKTGLLRDLALDTPITVGATGASGSDRTTFGHAGSGGRGGASSFGAIARASGGSGGVGGVVTRFYNWTTAYRGAGGIGNSLTGNITGDGGGWSGAWDNGVGNGGAGGYPGRRNWQPDGGAIPGSDLPATPGSSGSAGSYLCPPESPSSTWHAGGGGGSILDLSQWQHLAGTWRGQGWRSPGALSRGMVALRIE